jgi:hypothetical protein
MAAKEIGSVKVVLTAEDKATPQLTQSLKQIKEGVKQAEEPFKNILSLKNALIIGVIGGMAKAALDAAAKFTAMGNALQGTAYKLSLTEKGARELLFRIQDLGKTSPFATEALVSAFNKLTEAGLTAEAALGTLDVAQQVAGKTGEDLATVSNFIGKALEENLVGTPEEAAALFEELAKTAAAAGVPVADLVSAFFSNASAAKAAGISLNELVTLMGTDVAALGLTSGLELLKNQLGALAGDPKAMAFLAQLPAAFQVKPGDKVSDIVEKLAMGLANLSPEEIEKIKTLRGYLIATGEKTLADILSQIVDISDEDLKKTLTLALVGPGAGGGDTTTQESLTDKIGKFVEGVNLGLGGIITNLTSNKTTPNPMFQQYASSANPFVGNPFSEDKVTQFSKGLDTITALQQQKANEQKLAGEQLVASILAQKKGFDDGIVIYGQQQMAVQGTSGEFTKAQNNLFLFNIEMAKTIKALQTAQQNIGNSNSALYYPYKATKK